MQPLDAECLLTCIAEALETMAFIAVEPVDAPAIEEEQPEVLLAFDGSVKGELRLTAPRALGALIAENLLAEAGEAAAEKADDALGEITNIITGLLFRNICDPSSMPSLSVPAIARANAAQFFEGATCSASLSAEGHPLSVSVKVA